MAQAVTSSDMARSLTLRRYGAVVAGSNGRPTLPTPADTTFVGSLQPHAAGVKTQMPSSGKRRRADVVVYTEDTPGFRTAATGSQVADRIVDPVTNVVYEVIGTEVYTEILPHEVAYCVRLDEAAG